MTGIRKSTGEEPDVLVRFAVDPSALRDELAVGVSRHASAMHRTLLEKWMSHGIMVAGGPRLPETDFWSAVGELPQQYRKYYEEAFRKGRLRFEPAPQTFPKLDCVDCLEQVKPAVPHVRIACLESLRWDLVCNEASDAPTYLAFDGSLEIVEPALLARSVRFEELSQRSRTPIERGRKTLEVWRERFEDLVRFARHIVVVDRYAGVGLCEGGEAGLWRFLNEVDRCATGVSVVIYTALRANSRWMPADLMTAVRRFAASRGGIRGAVEVRILNDMDFGSEAHDRFIRVDDTFVEIGTGLEVLAGTEVERTTTFSSGTMDDEHRRIEKRLAGCCRL
ncbi:MAG: hypothetical protein ACKO3T_26630 [Planctomycetaceae bacterium]